MYKFQYKAKLPSAEFLLLVNTGSILQMEEPLKNSEWKVNTINCIVMELL